MAITTDRLAAMEPAELLDFANSAAPFENLDEDVLEYLAAAAIGLHTATMDPTLGANMPRLYQEYAARVPAGRRQTLVAATTKAIFEGALPLAALVPFFMAEPETHIASMATLDTAVLTPLQNGDPLTGPRRMIDVFRSRAPKNRAAVFAGLLLLGDARVDALLREVRDDLAEDELGTVSRAHSGFVFAATVEFWLAWLEELPGNADDFRFGCVAAALANIGDSAHAPEVFDGERVFPVRDEEEPIVLKRRWPFDKYARGVARRLRAVARRELEPKILWRVILSWTRDSQ